MAEVADALIQREIAGRAFAALAGGSESGIEGAMGHGWGSSIGVVFDIVELSLGDLQNALADYILDGPADDVVRGGLLVTAGVENARCYLLDAELHLLEAFGQLVSHLLLDGTWRYRRRHLVRVRGAFL